MPKIIVADRSGEIQHVEAEVGQSIMQVICDNGIDDMLAICGGCCSCATCHIYVDPAMMGDLEPIDELENDLLDSSDYRKKTSRLSCQIFMTENLNCLKVTIAPED